MSAWPAIGEPEAAFASFIADQEIPAEHLSDVYLAWAAVRGDDAAVREVSRWVTALAGRAVRATGVQGYEPRDLEQDLLQLLLVGTAERDARLKQYAGKGPLRAWLRSCAIRECLTRRRRKTALANADVPAQLADLRDDPELGSLKAADREAFAKALGDAFGALDSSTRTLLRYYYLDELDQRQIALIYQVHHATISRRLDKARESIQESARLVLSTRGTPAQVWSLVRSRLDVSLQSLLQTIAPE